MDLLKFGIRSSAEFAVLEPATMFLLGIGLMGVAGIRRKLSW